MRAGFRYQYMRLLSQAADGGSSFYKGVDVSFVSGKEYGEGGELTFGRFLLIDKGEYL